MKRQLTMVLVLTLAASAVFAGGNAEEAEPAPASEESRAPVEVKFMHVFGGERGEAIGRVVDGFNASQDGIVVTHENVPGWYGGLLERLQQLAVADQLPEVAIMGLSASNYMREGLDVVSVSDYIERDGYSTDDFIPEMLRLAQDPETGEQFALPYAVSTPLIYVNKDLMREAGIDASEAPDTWMELREWARVAHEAHDDAHGIAFQLDFDTWQFQQLLESFGGRMADAEAEEVLFNSEAGMRVMDMWLGMMHEDGSWPNISGSEAADNFTNGSLAMIVATTGNLARFNRDADFDLGILLLPEYDDDRRRNERRIPAGGSNIYVMPTTEEKQDAAWEFIKFALSPESTQVIVEELGYMSPRQSLLDEDGLLSGFVAENPQALRSYEQLEDLVGWYNWPGTTDARITQNMLDNMYAAFNEEQSGEEALNNAAAEAERILGW
ncbi:MAG: ABC transporter substrate-binding protein [Spirochaetota bacterium]